MTLFEILMDGAAPVFWMCGVLIAVSAVLVTISALIARDNLTVTPAWRSCGDCGTAVYFPSAETAPSEAVCDKCLFMHDFDESELAARPQSIFEARIYDELEFERAEAEEFSKRFGLGRVGRYPESTK